MTISAALVTKPITLDHLAALSEEIAALARAGVPLDRGLIELSFELPGRLGALAGDVGQRAASGAPLDRIVAELGTTLPPAYRTVIAAGLRAGHLPAALEGVARTVRRISQLRQSLGLAFLYPLVILLLTWSFGLFLLNTVAPVMVTMLKEFNVRTAAIEAVLDQLIRTVPIWGPLVPLVLVSWMGWVWYRSGRVVAGVELHPLLAFGAVGTLARMQRASRCASLAELLGLLIRHDVPLPEAIELASSAVGSESISKSGSELAQRLRRGETIHTVPRGFPPLLAWTLCSGDSQPRLAQTLSRTAEVYREEAARRSQWLTFYVPLLLTIVVCGGIVFIYAMLTLGPWIAIMRRLSEPF